MTTTTRQRTLSELRNMSPEQIAAAHQDGGLEDLLAGKDPGQIDEATLKTMSPEAISEAHREGRLDSLLGK